MAEKSSQSSSLSAVPTGATSSTVAVEPNPSDRNRCKVLCAPSPTFPLQSLSLPSQTLFVQDSCWDQKAVSSHRHCCRQDHRSAHRFLQPHRGLRSHRRLRRCSRLNQSFICISVTVVVNPVTDSSAPGKTQNRIITVIIIFGEAIGRLTVQNKGGVHAKSISVIIGIKRILTPSSTTHHSHCPNHHVSTASGLICALLSMQSSPLRTRPSGCSHPVITSVPIPKPSPSLSR